MRARGTVVIGRLIAIVLLCAPGFAQAETDECIPISAVPVTITGPGVYCLTQRLVTTVPSGNAITIASSNVVLDFRGHFLKGTQGGPQSTSVGVFAAGERNITIRNGTIQGFRVGIELRDEPFAITGYLVERMRLHGNSRAGVWVVGGANIIRDNLVTETGGDTTSIQAFIAGIRVSGVFNRVLNNDVDHVVKGFTDEDQLKAGIFLANS